MRQVSLRRWRLRGVCRGSGRTAGGQGGPCEASLRAFPLRWVRENGAVIWFLSLVFLPPSPLASLHARIVWRVLVQDFFSRVHLLSFFCYFNTILLSQPVVLNKNPKSLEPDDKCSMQRHNRQKIIQLDESLQYPPEKSRNDERSYLCHGKFSSHRDNVRIFHRMIIFNS